MVGWLRLESAVFFVWLPVLGCKKKSPPVLFRVLYFLLLVLVEGLTVLSVAKTWDLDSFWEPKNG